MVLMLGAGTRRGIERERAPITSKGRCGCVRAPSPEAAFPRSGRLPARSSSSANKRVKKARFCAAVGNDHRGRGSPVRYTGVRAPGLHAALRFLGFGHGAAEEAQMKDALRIGGKKAGGTFPLLQFL